MTGIVAEEGAFLDLTVAAGTYVKGSYDGKEFEFGNTAAGYTVQPFCALYVGVDGLATDTTVESGGALYADEGGTATGANIASDGRFIVSSGGTATGIVAEEGAFFNLAVAPDTLAQGTYGGSAFEVGETVDGFTVALGCDLNVYEGGTAENVTVDYGGDLFVNSGGTALAIREHGGYV